MKYVCRTSGIEFESDKKIGFIVNHPALLEVLRGIGIGDGPKVARITQEIRAAGNYVTIEEYIALLQAELVNLQLDKESRRVKEAEFLSQRQAEQEAAKQREVERRAANEAARQQKLREDGLNPRATRQAQNALLKAYGYQWKKVYVVDEFDPDEGDDKWILLDPDGVQITLYRALDEIKRGRDVVRAEMAQKAEEAKVAEVKLQAEREIKRQQEAEALARLDASLNVIDALVEKIEANCTPIELSEGLRLKVEWQTVAMADKSVEAGTHRYHDCVKKASAGDGKWYYLAILNTGFDNDGFYKYFIGDDLSN